MKMDINLQFKKYDLAKAAAKRLIDLRRAFELYPMNTESEPSDLSANYRNLFTYKGEQNKERIFFTKDGANDIWFRNMGTPLGGQGCAAPLKSLLDTYGSIDGKTISIFACIRTSTIRKESAV